MLENYIPAHNNKNDRIKFFNSVKKTISDYDMLHSGDTLLVAVSGGPDSVALLHVMLELSEIFSLKLGIAHLNHTLRGQESDNDALFVELMARRLNLSFYLSKKNVLQYQRNNRLSLEDAARRVRYSFFSETAERYGFDRIATGHHSDDNAELVLMNILRGSGHKGISGIPPVRKIFGSKQLVIRPLIKLTRADILLFLKEQHIEYVVDQSNYDTSLLRNRIRYNLIPELKKLYNPGVTEALNRLSAIVSDEEKWIDDLTNSIFEKNKQLRNESRIGLSIVGIESIDVAALRRVLRQAVKIVKGNLKSITFAHINSIINLLKNGSSSWNLDLPVGIRIQRSYGILFVSKEEKMQLKSLPVFVYMVQQPESGGSFLLLPDRLAISIKFTVVENMRTVNLRNHKKKTAFFDMDALNFPLMVRNLMPGDRFRPLGCSGTQKVKKYFINKKVPRQDRACTPVLLNKEKIIWLAGHQIDESAKIKDSTVKVLKVELLPHFACQIINND